MYPKKCQACNENFLGQVKTSRYCSISCANIASSAVFENKPKCLQCQAEFYRPSPSKNHKFCNKNCEMNYRRKDRIEIVCKTCNKKMSVSQSNKNKKFCSRKCMGKDYKNKFKNFKPQHRSYGECAIVVLFRKNYPTLSIKTNDREQLDGLELDIWLPDLHIGIEYNGPHHYKPVYGLDVFERTKFNDALKMNIANQKNIKLIHLIQNGSIGKTSKTKIVDMFIDCCNQCNLPHPSNLNFTFDEIKSEQSNCQMFFKKTSIC